MGLSLRILDFQQNHLHFYMYTFQSQKKTAERNQMEKQPILAIALIVPILGLFGGK